MGSCTIGGFSVMSGVNTNIRVYISVMGVSTLNAINNIKIKRKNAKNSADMLLS